MSRSQQPNQSAHTPTPLDPDNAQPAPLTKRALRELRLEDMRLRGEPLDDMTERTPTFNVKRNGINSAFDNVPGFGTSTLRLARADSLIDKAFPRYRVRRKRAFERRPVQPRRQRPTSNHTVPEVAPHVSPHLGWNSDLSDNISVNSRFVWPVEDGGFFVFPETQSFLSRCRSRSERRRRDKEREAPLARSLQREESLLDECRQPEREEHAAQKRQRSESNGLFHSFDMNAFSDDDDSKPASTSGVEALNVPTNLPPHTVVNAAAALQPYLDSAEYVISLGGAALPDLKYGIIVIPRGEEEMFLRDHEDAMPPAFKTEILDKSRAMRKQQIAELREEELQYLMKSGRDPSSSATTDKLTRSYNRKERKNLGGSELPAPELLPGTEPSFAQRRDSGWRTSDGPGDSSPSFAPRRNSGEGASDDSGRFLWFVPRRNSGWKSSYSDGDCTFPPVDPPRSFRRQNTPPCVDVVSQNEDANDFSSSVGSLRRFRRQSPRRSADDVPQNENAPTDRSRSVSRKRSSAPPLRVRVVRTFIPRRLRGSTISPLPLSQWMTDYDARSRDRGFEDSFGHDYEQRSPPRSAEQSPRREPRRHPGYIAGESPERSPRLLTGEAGDWCGSSYSYPARERADHRWTSQYNSGRDPPRGWSRRLSSTSYARRRSLSPRRSVSHDYELRRAPLSGSGGDDDDHGGWNSDGPRRRRGSDASNSGYSDAEGIRPPVHLQSLPDSTKSKVLPSQPVKSLPSRGAAGPTQDASPSTLECPGRESPPLSAGPKSPPRLDPDKETATASQESHAMSSEALYALENLLSQAHRPPKRRRRSFRSILNKLRRKRNASLGEPPRDAEITRQLLLQIGDVVSSLAAGELDENPGIDPRTWDAAQKAIKAS